MKYVIIGNSTAAVNAIEAIREIDREGSITVLSDEKHFSYGRPLISYYLYGKISLENMNYKGLDFYEKNDVTTLLGVTAVKIDSEKKTVLLEDGREIEYDKLLVATGSRPFVPPMAGLEKVKEKYSFMKLDDALSLEKALGKDKNVLIIGAGLIGLKCLEGILDRVGKVTVVDMANRVLPSILDEEGSLIIQKQLEEKGVTFILNDSVAEFSCGTQALLKSGKALNFDILVLAVGVRANIELVKDAGGDCERGILTDESQKTSLPDIYAAGDCAASLDYLTNTKKVLALLPNAALQGRTAGHNMAGKEETFTQGIPMNAIGFFGSHVMTAGYYEGEVYEEKTSSTYKKLFYRDNLLKGFIIIGDIARAGIYTSLIRNKTPLDTINFELIKKQPVLAAFSKENRAKKLTERV